MRRVLISGAVALGLLYGLMRGYERWYFPRDPERTVDPGAAVVSPADGRVVYMARVDAGTVPISIKQRTEIPLTDIVKGANRPSTGTLIGIFMSPFDVHYQRSPISGTVTEISYHPVPYNYVMGSMFLRNLFRIQPMYAKSPHIVENERNIIRISGEHHDAYVVQIADQQVNKIDCYVSVGDIVAIGEKIGMIRRGSQVDLYLPGVEPSDLTRIEVGRHLAAGESPLLA
jgi:phosphatidylserine decarboxylase